MGRAAPRPTYGVSDGLALLQVREEAGRALGPDDAAPSRAAADAMTYTVSALQACFRLHAGFNIRKLRARRLCRFSDKRPGLTSMS